MYKGKLNLNPDNIIKSHKDNFIQFAKESTMTNPIDKFITKFEAIPDDLWIEGELHDPATGACCALGHCGVRDVNGDWDITEEAKELCRALFGHEDYEYVYAVNDDRRQIEYPGKTPKERILNQLYAAKFQAVSTNA